MKDDNKPVTRSELKDEFIEFEDRLVRKFATKEDHAEIKVAVAGIETDVSTMREDLADVKVELTVSMTSLVEDLKRHFDFTVEQIRSDRDDATELQLTDHEQRISRLEIKHSQQ